MDYLHTDFWGGQDHLVVVDLDAQANVCLLSDSDFDAYRHGRSFHYYGGLARETPVRMRPPHHGRWHVVVDLGGRCGRVRAGVRVMTMA